MKNERGHGSEPRKGFPNIERSALRKGQHVGYGKGEAWNIVKDDNGYMAVGQRSGQSLRGESLSHVSKQLALGGNKSGVVPVHSGARGRS